MGEPMKSQRKLLLTPVMHAKACRTHVAIAQGLVAAIAAAAILASAPRPCSAQTYDVAADFSAAANPNGVWSYGALPATQLYQPSAFALYKNSTFVVDGTCCEFPDWQEWNFGPQDPNVFHSTATQTEIFPGNPANIVINPGEFVLHPGPDGTFSVARWTAPSSGAYSIAVSFYGVNQAPTTTDVHVLKNGNELFVAFVNDYRVNHSFSTTVSTQVGDEIDFAVGLGDDGTYVADSTALTATVTKLVPPVPIEIKPPASAPVPINQSSSGVIPVAIISSPTFDATTVDPTTVALAGAEVQMIGKSGKYSCSAQDVNGDGLNDLVCQVSTAQFLIQPGQSNAVLQAKTFGGQPIQGQEAITIVPQ